MMAVQALRLIMKIISTFNLKEITFLKIQSHKRILISRMLIFSAASIKKISPTRTTSSL
jgi:hypothetical protein